VNSGADFICVATRLLQQLTPPPLPAEATTASASSSRPAAFDPPATGTVPSKGTIPYNLRSNKRQKVEGTVSSASSHSSLSSPPQDILPEFVFVNVCCATYKGGVPNTQHEKDIALSREQFLDRKGGKYGKNYASLVKRNRCTFEYLPVLVEIPRIEDATPSSEYIHVTEHNATKLFSQDVVNALVHRRSVIA
jgi:hypothetical protein